MPLELLSEEAQEFIYKDIKIYRKLSDTKFSRTQNIENLFNNLHKKDSKINKFPKELKYLLNM